MCDILHIPLYLLVNREMIIIYSVGGGIEWREIEYLERERAFGNKWSETNNYINKLCPALKMIS